MKKWLTYLIVTAIPSVAMAYSSGPPDAKTGAPGEGTCHDCHASFPLNSGNGTLSIDGPASYEAGHTYQISVHLSDPGQARWGFEFTPLNQGTIQITDATHTQQHATGGNTYVKHTTAGTYAGNQNGPTTWSFNWTAPASPPSSITFYAAGNASNNNGNNSGDYIYTTSFTSNFNTGINDNDLQTPGAISLGNYPNPFNAQTTIQFDLTEASHTRLDIYDINGQKVSSLINEEMPAGHHQVIWNASDQSSGVYFYRLETGSATENRRMLLVK
jgi:hypothetical protein